MPPRSNNAVINRMHNEIGVGRSLGLVPPNQRGADITFGAPTKADPEGVGKVMFDWVESPPPKEVVDHGRDFLRLNKLAVHEGMATASDVAQFRNTHDCRITTKPGTVLKLKSQCPANMDHDHVYGAPRRTDPATMHDLLHHTFEHEWLAERDRRLAKTQGHPKTGAHSPPALHKSHSSGPASPHSPSKVTRPTHLNTMAKLDPVGKGPRYEEPLEEEED